MFGYLSLTPFSLLCYNEAMNIQLLFIIPLMLTAVLSAETFHFDFSENYEGWTGDFADYPVGEEAFYELRWGWENLPYPESGNEKGLVISGNNHSDDLMMFFKHQITGLKPNTEYELTYTVTIQTNIPEGQFGVGGSPGESVFFKVGASNKEPIKIIEKGYYRINIDVGNQSVGGGEGLVIGNLANSAVDEQDRSFKPKEMSTLQVLKSHTDDQGRMWLFVGTDSGFEGTSLYYIENINVEIVSSVS